MRVEGLLRIMVRGEQRKALDVEGNQFRLEHVKDL